MPTLPAAPCALTIAGSDSGGGAGIQADLKTFAAFRVHGLSAVTCLTAQNPRVITAVQPATPALLRAQLLAVHDGFRPAAIKTGMLYSRALIEVTAQYIASEQKIPLVVDPVMVATSGRPLLSRTALTALVERLLPLATLMTPNLPEAAVLLGTRIRTMEQQRAAARSLVERYRCAVVVKGGHAGGSEAADIFFDGKRELLLTAPRIRGVKTHGTGCTFSAAITASLARGKSLEKAVVEAKHFVTQAIAGSRSTGSFAVLGLA